MARADIAMERQPGFAGFMALAIVLGVSSLVASGWLCWLFGLPLDGRLSLAFALVATATLLHWCGLAWRRAAVLTALTLGVSALLTAVMLPIRDLSDDGQEYHQMAIALMQGGWNPLQHTAAPMQGSAALWITAYAKTHWVFGALLFDITGNLEAGKSLGCLVALASGLAGYAWLRERLGWSRRAAAWLAAVAALNPVFDCQWPTFLNDDLVGSLILLGIAAAALAGSTAAGLARRDGLLAAFTFALLASVKASGVAYGVMLLLAAAALALCLAGVRSMKRVSVAGLAGIAAGTLLLGFDPYVTNFVQHGNPFYPLAGKGKVDIISYNAPPGVMDASRVAKLFGSMLARSSSVGTYPTSQSVLAPKLPGTVAPIELKPFLTKSAVHVGGMGPLFSLALLVAVLGAAWAAIRASARERLVLLVPATLLIASALSFPEPWWERYVPQIWLIPLALAVPLIQLGRRAGRRACWRWGWAAVAVAATDSALVALLFVAGNVPRQLDLQTQFASLRNLSAEAPIAAVFPRAQVMAWWLARAGVRWVPGDADRCIAPSSWVQVEYTRIRVCLDPQQSARHQVNSPVVQKIKGYF